LSSATKLECSTLISSSRPSSPFAAGFAKLELILLPVLRAAAALANTGVLSFRIEGLLARPLACTVSEEGVRGLGDGLAFADGEPVPGGLREMFAGSIEGGFREVEDIVVCAPTRSPTMGLW
jgi:hypothetical protein